MNKFTPNLPAHTRGWRIGLRRIGLGLVMLLTGMPAIAQVVTTLTDNVAAPPAGSLRAALNTANASGSAATVTFNITGGGTINLAGALPILRNPNGISINGANGGQGAITIDGGSSSATTGDRIFFVGVRASDNTGLVGTPSANWNISNLTLQNGNARGGAGGAGSNISGGWSAGGGGAGLGGAIFVNEGSLSVAGVTFLNNRATGGNGGILSAAVAEGGTGGGGGMAGTGGNGSFYNAGGGGGFGLGANGGIGAGGAGSAGRFVGATSGGAGSGAGFGAGGASGGGGGGSSNNQNGGGGGPGGEAATTSGPPGGAGRAGNGAFGGGGGGAGGNNNQVGGNGGYGGGGGGAGAGDGGFGGFGGGGGGGAGSPIGAAGFAGGDGSIGYGGGGGGAGLGGAVFVRQGASLNVIGGGMSGGVVAGGTAGPGASIGVGVGTAAFLAGSLNWSVASGQTVTLASGSTLGGGSDPLIGGGLTKSGPGTLVLGGNNNYVGATTVAAGDLRINGNNLGTGAVSVEGGATLSGIGTLAGATSVASGGTVAPGQAAPGRLTTADLALATGATVAAQITGATVATQYDQLAVIGTVNLGGATLALSGGFVPGSGQSFVLIDNDDSDAVTGTFAGLAQGATLTFNGVQLTISYSGGDGNDVVLTAAVDPCATFASPYTLAGNTPAELIQAIQCANANGTADLIDLAGQSITLTTAFADYSGATALPQITTAVTLRNGTLTRGGSNLFRMLSVGATGNLSLRNVTVSNSGGAGYSSLGAALHNLGTARVIGSRLIDNSGNRAVAIYSTNILAVANSTIAGNAASQHAAILEMSGTATIANSVVSGNRSATSDNIWVTSGSLSLINSAVAYNYTATAAPNASGAFYLFDTSALTVRNSILWGNRNDNNSADQIEVGGSATPTVSNSIIEGGIFGGLNSDPLFVAPIAVLSTPTTAGDLQLSSSSPAIDAGANADVIADSFDVNDNSNTTEDMPDRAGNSRRVDDAGVADTGTGTAPIVDLGAYERQTDSTVASDFTVTTTATSITVTDSSGNGSTLSASEPVANTLRFDAAGRTFSVNGGPPITGNSGNLALPGITGITIDATGGTSVATGAFFNIGTSSFTSGSPVTLAGGTLKAIGTTAVVNAPITMSADSSMAGTMLLAGPISGDFTLRTVAPGTYRFASTSSSFSRLQISSGTVALGGNNTLPPAIDIFNSASFNLNGFSQSVDFYAGAGSTQNTGATADLSIGVVGSASSFGSANYTGPISGPIDLTIAAGGSQTLGSNSSSYTGTTTVSGALRITGNSALGATGAGNGTTITATGSIDLSNVAYAGVEAITLHGGTLRTSSGNSSFPGPVTLATGTGSIRVDNAASELVLDGVLGGSQGFIKLGAGTVRLTQANTYTGPTSINGGRVLVTGSTAAASTVTASIGGTLGGTGTVNGPILVPSGGTLAPGVTIGTLHTANVSMASGATFAVGITGATVDTQYDQLDVNGTVSLSGATLALSGAYVPATGESFTLIDNDGSDAVSGIFDGLPEGSLVTFNDVTLAISYVGGTGNDVVLTAVVVLPTATVVSLERASGNPRNSPTVTWTITFSAPVSGLSPGNFSVTTTGLGGLPTVLSATSADNVEPAVQWNISAGTGTGDGTLRLDIVNDGGLSHELTNLPFTGQVFTIDRTPPTVTITVADDDLTSAETSPVSFVFSEPVDQLQLAGLGVPNAALTTPITTDNVTWTATLTPTAEVNAPTNAVTLTMSGLVDAAGNAGVGIATSNNYAINTVGRTLSVADVTRNEGFNGVSAFDVVVTLSAPAPVGGVSFDIATADGTATAGSDYSARNFTSRIILEGSSTYTLSVPVNGDAVQEADETFFVNVSNVTGANVADGQGLGTIVNDDIAGITVSPTSGLVTTEVGGTDTFTVVLDSQPTADVTIALSSSDTTEGTAAPTSLVFTAATWNVAQTVSVTGVDDAIVDGDVAYSIVTDPAASADAFYSGMNPADVAVSNTDNDTAGVSITQSGGSNVVSEDGSTDSYSIVLGSQPTATVNVSISFPANELTINGDTDGSFNSAFTTANWNVPQTITLAAVNDRALEGDHSADLVHAFTSSDPNYNAVTAVIDGGASSNALTVAITDNESAQLRWSQPSASAAEGSDVSSAVVLDITANPPGGTPTLDGTISYTLTPTFDTAQAADISTSAGALSFNNVSDLASSAISIAHLADTLVEGTEQYSLAITLDTAPAGTSVASAPFVGTIIDTNNASLSLSGGATVSESTGSAALTVTLDIGAGNTLANAVTVAIDLTDGSASYAGGSGDYFFPGPGNTATVTFPPGAGNAATQSVSVSIRDDVLVENTESFSASLGAVTGTASASAAPAVISVTDNDVAVVSFQSPGSSVSEGTTPHSVNALLTITAVGTGTPALAEPITVTITQTPGTADAADYTLSTPSITFAVAAASGDMQPVSVAINDDLIVEGNETFALGFGAVTGPATASGSHTITLVDNDTAGIVVTQSGGSTAITEGGNTDTYSLVLTSQPTADVVIAINADSQLTAAPTSLTFTTSTWNVPQTVTVAAVDDAVVEAHHSGTLGHVVSSSDSNYNAISIPALDVDVTDNDSAVVSVSPVSVSQSESTSPMNFAVTLSNPVQSGVTLRVDSAFGTATAADFTPVVGGTVSFAPNSTTSQTISIDITNDALDENDESFTLTLSDLAATGDVALGDAVATGTIINDDLSPTLAITSPTQPEGNTGTAPMDFVVSLSTISGRDVTFTAATQDGTATVADNDYVPVPPTLVTIPAGQLSITIPVPINADTVYEGEENFSLHLTGIGNATPSSLDGIGTIVEDDAQPTTTTITGDLPDPSVVGQPYTVDVSVSAQTLSPLGTLTITDGTESCGPIPLTAGTPPASSASCELTGSSAGARTLTATYTPASDAFAASSDTEAHQVDAAATAISVSGPASAAINQPIAFSFTLSVPAPGGGTPSGVVTLSTAGSSCEVVVPTATPSCELTFATLGPATVSASFAPDNDDHLAATSSGAGNASTLVVAAVDLQLTKSDADATAQPGATVPYTLSYRNVGIVDATGVVLGETVPANTRFDQATSSPGWSCADNAPAGTACSLVMGTVTAGAPAASATFAVRVDAALPEGVDAVSNTASVGDDGSNGEDATPADNIAVESTPVDASADMSVRKSTTATGFVPGQPVVYQLDYRNDGNRAATGVVVIETVPDDTVFVAASSTPGWSCADGAVGGTECAWPVGTVAAGEEGSLEFAVALRNGPVGDVIRNSVRIEDDGSNGTDPTPDNNTSDVALSASNPAAPPAPTIVPATGWPAHLLLMLALMMAGGTAWNRQRRCG